MGRQTASRAWAGTAHRCEREMRVMRGMTVPANWHYLSNRGTKPTTLMRGHRRSLWLAAWKGSKGEGLDALERRLTLSAPTAGTAVSWAPGRLLAGFFPAEAWRNSGQVEHGEAVPWSNGS